MIGCLIMLHIYLVSYHLCFMILIIFFVITITISSNMIGALAALFFTNHSVELQPDSWL